LIVTSPVPNFALYNLCNEPDVVESASNDFVLKWQIRSLFLESIQDRGFM